MCWLRIGDNPGAVQSIVSSRTRLGATGRTWVFKTWSKDVGVEEARRIKDEYPGLLVLPNNPNSGPNYDLNLAPSVAVPDIQFRGEG